MLMRIMDSIQQAWMISRQPLRLLLFFLLLMVACRPAEQLVRHEIITPEASLQYTLLQEGSGEPLGHDDLAWILYEAMLEDGTVFDRSADRDAPMPVRLGTTPLLPGLEEVLYALRAGDEALIVIPPELGYGEAGYGQVPPNESLTYRVEVVRIGMPRQLPPLGEARIHTTDSGLSWALLERENGEPLQAGMRVSIHYEAYLADESKLDSSLEREEPISAILGRGMLIPGWEEGLALLKTGDRARLWVPSHLAYGSEGRGAVPPDTDLIFDLQVLDAAWPELPQMYAATEDTDTIVSVTGLEVYLFQKGDGPRARAGNKLLVHYAGFLPDSSLFDSSWLRGEPVRFVLGARQVIEAWEEGFSLLNQGSRARFVVPPHLSGDMESLDGRLPKDTLLFDVKLLEIIY